MACELCGSMKTLVTAKVEGVSMRVCEKCAGYGTVIKQAPQNTPLRRKTSPSNEPIEHVVDNIGTLLRQAREKRGMTQKDFARYLAEKESFIQKVESGSIHPQVPTAQTWEKKLGIKLVLLEEQEETTQRKEKTTGAFTIGDSIGTN